MTTPAYPNAISIQNIKKEFGSRGAYNDLNNWGRVVLGRTPGATVSLSEFWGRSNEVTYYVGIGAADYSMYDTPIYFTTVHGTVELRVVNARTHGNNHINLIHTAGAAWNKFKQVTLTDGNVYGPGSFTYQNVWGSGEYHFFRAGYIPAGNLTWVYYG